MFYGWYHGDVHAKNVCFKNNVPTIFDFVCMGYGWRAYDICVFAWYETFNAYCVDNVLKT
jgi:Ser/Thr protein kinase RdoA (MazF antagonist)